MLLTVLALVGTTLAAVFLIPQTISLVRSGNSVGVSPTWAAFGVVTNLAWVVYLFDAGLPTAAAAPAIATVCYVMVLKSLARLTTSFLWSATGLAYLFAMVAVGGVGGIAALGVVLLVAPALQLAPQVASVIREPLPSGPSPTTWSLAVLEAMTWGAYGLLAGDVPLVGYAIVTSAGSMVVLVRRLAPNLKVRSPLVQQRGSPSIGQAT
ncbi:MAG TPA: PQ-loop domain-containing transporter [Acidimicrobiia bacterium]